LLTGQRNVEQQSQQQHQHRLNHELDHRDQAAKATQAAASDSSEVRTEDGRVGDVRELPFRVLLHVPFTLAPKVALSDCFCVLSRSKQPPTRGSSAVFGTTRLRQTLPVLPGGFFIFASVRSIWLAIGLRVNRHFLSFPPSFCLDSNRARRRLCSNDVQQLPPRFLLVLPRLSR